MAETNNTSGQGTTSTEPTDRQEDEPLSYLDRILALHGANVEGGDSDDDDSTYVYGEDDGAYAYIYDEDDGYTPSTDGALVGEDRIASESDSEDDDNNDNRSEEDGGGSEGEEVQVRVSIAAGSSTRSDAEAGAAPWLSDVPAETNANRIDRVVSLANSNSNSDEAATSEDDSSYSYDYDDDYDYLYKDDGSSTSASGDEDEDRITFDGLDVESHGLAGAEAASLVVLDVPAETLGMALGYLALADVLSCRRTQNRHLGRDAIHSVRHLNVMTAEELDARYAATFPSVQSVNVLCLLTDFKLSSRSSSSSTPTAKCTVNERAVQRIASFLKSIGKLKRAFLGGHFDGTKRVYEARSCRDSDKQDLISKLFESLCLSFFPTNFLRGLTIQGLESVEGSWCLSVPIGAMPASSGSALTRAQIHQIMKRLVAEGAMRKVFVTRPTHSMGLRSMTSREQKADFIIRMARMGSRNDGIRQAILCLKDGTRSVLQGLFAYDAAATRVCAGQAALTQSLRSCMREIVSNGVSLAVGKLVIRNATLDFLIDTIGFGLDRDEFIPIDFDAEPAVPDYCLWDP